MVRLANVRMRSMLLLVLFLPMLLAFGPLPEPTVYPPPPPPKSPKAYDRSYAMPNVTMQQGRLLVDNVETYLWGVNWQPQVLGVAGYAITSLKAEQEAAYDAPNISAAGFNVIKLAPIS